MKQLFVRLGVVVFAMSCAAPDGLAKKREFHEPNLCGPIALYVVCFSHGVETTIDELTELAGYDGFGVTVAGLVHASETKGLTAKAYASSMRHLRKLSSPGIVDYPQGHFCVIVGIRAEGVVLFDPPDGTHVVDPKEFADDWGGHLIIFERTLAR